MRYIVSRVTAKEGRLLLQTTGEASMAVSELRSLNGDFCSDERSSPSPVTIRISLDVC